MGKKYTVKTLIKKLEKYDPDLPVTVDGYEGGQTQRINIEVLKLGRDVNKGTWYYGEHEQISEWDKGKWKEFTSVNIGR